MAGYKVKQIFSITVGSILQHKLRSILSILGVICGTMTVVTFISVGQGAKETAIDQIEMLGIRNIYIKAVQLNEGQLIEASKKNSHGLSYYDVKRLSNACQFINIVAFLLEIKASVIGAPTQLTPLVVACSENYVQLYNISISSGRFFVRQDRQKKNLVCVLGSEIARKLEHQGILGQTVRINSHLFKVVGILDPIELPKSENKAISQRNFNEMIFIPLDTAPCLSESVAPLKSIITEDWPLSEIVVQINNHQDVWDAAIVIKRIMDVAHDGVSDYQVIVPLELLQQVDRTQLIFNLVTGVIAGVSLLVGGIGIMNIMLVTVTERTREIGIRRAVGATGKHILIQFLSEATLLTFCGGIIGLLCGLGASAIISWLAKWPVVLPVWGFILPLVLAFLAGIFFGLYPAIQAVRLDPIVALRHV